MMAILNALRAAPPKLGEVQPTVMAAAAARRRRMRRSACSSARRRSGSSAVASARRHAPSGPSVRPHGNQVFPVGRALSRWQYGPDVNLPVTQAEENNPELNGAAACIDRNRTQPL
jgi:hypothetical protein